jgi:phosphoribosyl-ATP pyrophosphohydrolase/phosphoribosyl-AMP cyclohydrolase
MLVPSIDLSNGKAVQLRQGKELVLECDRDPVELAREFNRYGEVAVIDLDAALGKGDNRELLKRMCAVADVRAGGGIRDVDSGRELLRAGAKSIIIGTKATPEFLSQFPRDRVIVALDNIDNQVVDNGWTNSTGESIWDRAERLNDFCNGYLVTFVRSEGTMTGLPIKAAQEVKERLKLAVTVAGGIANAEEVVELSQLGLDVQVGMALYQGKLQPADCVVGSVKFDEKGLVPTIVQDVSGQVLMLAYSNKESLKRSLTEGRGIYFSRSRQEIWQKGATSGNTQTVGLLQNRLRS